MEYGLIFHGTHTGKYYCKNMKYRINIIYISREISIEHPSVGLPSLAQLYIAYYTSKSGICIGYYMLLSVIRI